MQDILRNLANLELLRYCKNSGIDTLGTYVLKVGRGYTYGLCHSGTIRPIVTVTFTRNSTPIFKEFR